MLIGILIKSKCLQLHATSGLVHYIYSYAYTNSIEKAIEIKNFKI